jgi:hypothetical protein
MNRLQQRLADLESRFRAEGRHLVFICFPDEGPSRADQRAAFDAENGVTPSDIVHEVRVNFA